MLLLAPQGALRLRVAGCCLPGEVPGPRLRASCSFSLVAFGWPSAGFPVTVVLETLVPIFFCKLVNFIF